MRRALVRFAAALVAACLLTACDPAAPDAPATARFAAIRQAPNDQAGATFCEKQWPAVPTPGARRYREIPERPLPGERPVAPASGGTWKWVNLWATWCLPCVEEMRLLGRWQHALEEDGVGLDLELWSVDEDAAALGHFLETHTVPGRVHWLRSRQDLPAVLAALGADTAAGVPVQALVDPTGNLRCLRIGAVHDEDYGVVKTLLSGR